jgi:hypothetical protein
MLPRVSSIGWESKLYKGQLCPLLSKMDPYFFSYFLSKWSNLQFSGLKKLYHNFDSDIHYHLKIGPFFGCNVCPVKIRSKRSSNTLLRLLRIFTGQTLSVDNFVGWYKQKLKCILISGSEFALQLKCGSWNSNLQRFLASTRLSTS